MHVQIWYFSFKVIDLPGNRIKTAWDKSVIDFLEFLDNLISSNSSLKTLMLNLQHPVRKQPNVCF